MKTIYYRPSKERVCCKAHGSCRNHASWKVKLRDDKPYCTEHLEKLKKRQDLQLQMCEVPSLTLGPCDLPIGHDGKHNSAGDGFGARCGKCWKDLTSGNWYFPIDPKTLGYICGNCND